MCKYQILYLRLRLILVDLSTAINAESLAPLFADPEVRQRLSQFLPEVGDLTNSENEVKDTIQSPQFRQVCMNSCIQIPADTYSFPLGISIEWK